MSTSSAAQRQAEWEQLVDAIAAMDSTDALPPLYEAAAYLPGGRRVAPELVALVKADTAAHPGLQEGVEVGLFQPRMTEAEGCRAMPRPPTVASVKNANSRGVAADAEVDGEEDGEGEGEREGGNTNRRRRHGKAARREGDGGVADFSGDARDFHARYKAITSSSSSTANGGGGGTTSLASSPTGATAGGGGIGGSGSRRLTTGFLDAGAFDRVHREPDFMPIILVPSSVTAPIQLFNIRLFLTEGTYIDPATQFMDAQTGATNVQDTKPDTVIVSPGSFVNSANHTAAFREFRVVDDPVKIADWSHVVACVVTGKTWEFKGWFPHLADPRATEPSNLFTRVCGFLPYFEEDRVPPAAQQWLVRPVLLTRRATKTEQHIKEAFGFWEQLYSFMDQHPFFKLYDVRPDQ